MARPRRPRAHVRAPTGCTYHELLRERLAELAGALPPEVVAMNSLTVNLHLMMASFYRPTPERHAILVEDARVPVGRYAVDRSCASTASIRRWR